MLILSRNIKLRKGRPGFPNPMRSFEEYQTLNHLDLPELDDLQLWREEGEAKMELLRCDPNRLYIDSRGEVATVQGWYLQRIAKIRREKKRRQ